MKQNNKFIIIIGFILSLLILTWAPWLDNKEIHDKVFKEKAHKLVDAGATLIIGSHPHVIENIERYKGKLIFYSLGNFVFDQDFS